MNISARDEATLSVVDQQQAVPEASPTREQPKYPGVTIDQVFPISAWSSLIDDNGREDEQNVEVDGYTVWITQYVPRTLNKSGKTVFAFKKRQTEGYWGTLVGVSRLLGSENKEIYAVVSGPGGVCCTNYSIVDISSVTPRSIFHSEDFGYFRDPMEIFDTEADGIYELMQFDSCFRYFMDDCGACSPEPRAYFKYDAMSGQYVPAKRIVQDFVNEQMLGTKKWIEEKYQELRVTNNPSIKLDLHRAVLSHVANLLHIGKEKEAWQIFDKYSDDDEGKVRKEIRRRLAECKFYQALRKP